MPQISVVIITKNEALNIVGCILSAKKISNDIIVVDSGSTDATVLLARREGVKVELISWNCYGEARNTGATLASNDWILSLDADERVTNDLAASILSINFNENIVYGFKRLNYFGKKEIRHGAFSNDRVFRLYSRQSAKWNQVPVHEKLVGEKIKRVTLQSHAEHYGIRNASHFLQKNTGYAFLCAHKYKQEKKKKKFIAALRLLSPAFNFMQAYFFQLGFLDKRIGFIVAKINAHYTSKKYQQLYIMMQAEKKQMREPGVLRSSLKWISSLLS